MSLFNLETLKSDVDNLAAKGKLFTAEEHKKAQGGSGGGSYLGEGFHEDCVITVEKVDANAKFPKHTPINVIFSKDGKSKKMWLALSPNDIKIGDNANWAFDNLVKLYKATFKTPKISQVGVLAINKLILESLAKGEPTILDGIKVNVGIDYGVAPHAILVEDPNNPSAKVIKITMKIKNADGKWEEKFAKNATGMADLIFESFEAARKVGEEKFPKKFKTMPDISKLTGSVLQEVNEEVLNMFEVTYQMELNKITPKKEPEPVVVEEEEVIDVGTPTITEDDIFG